MAFHLQNAKNYSRENKLIYSMARKDHNFVHKCSLSEKEYQLGNEKWSDPKEDFPFLGSGCFQKNITKGPTVL